MFETVVGVIFIDQNRDFIKLSDWLIDTFFIFYYEEICEEETFISEEETFISFEWEECAFEWQRDGYF